MPTKEIFYTSGTVSGSGLQATMVDNLKPNHKYEFSFQDDVNNPRHMKTGSEVSGLLHTSSVEASAESLEYIAPSDNIYVDIELARNGNSIDVNLLDFEYQNYTEYNYNFNVKAFSNLERTSQAGSTTFNNTMNTMTFPDTRTMNVSNDITNVVNYFQVQDFYNSTVNTHVYADRNAKISGTQLTLKLYDVRGLAYMRGKHQNPTEIPPLNDADLPGVDINTQTEVHVSAEGTRMIVAKFDSSSAVVYKYRLKNGTWNLVGSKTGTGTPNMLFRYPNASLRNNYSVMYGAAGFSEYGDIYLISVNSIVTAYQFDTDSVIGNINFGRPVHCMTVSADGRLVLVSANHATSSDYFNLYGPRGGTVKLYSLTSFTEVAEIPTNTSIDNEMYYGSDSAISGDGNTIVVFGSVNRDRSFGYVWKINSFTGYWENMVTLEMGDNYNRVRAPCAISHDGKVIVVCSTITDEKAFIYETDDYEIWTSQEIPLTGMNSCDISGDGKTVLFAMHEVLQQNFTIYTKTGSDWEEDTSYSFDQVQSTRPFGSCALSYDGSTVCLQMLKYHYTYTVQFDKNTTINTVYDYFNLKSNLYFKYNYTFNYTTDITVSPIWSGGSTQTLNVHEIDSVNETAYYGYWDSTSISADGRFVLVGSPMENKVCLYDTNKNEVAHTFTGSNYYGVRCAMDDLAKKVVVVNHTDIYFYERSAEGFTQKGNTDHGYGSSLYQFKMSKDGSTVILTRAKNAKEIQKWALETNLFLEWTWDAVPNSTTLKVPDSTLPGTKNVSGIDLSYNGDIIVAGQDLNGSDADLTVFYPGGHISTTISFTAFRYMHSVAISSVPNTASGEYTIITGDCDIYQSPLTTAYFHIYKFNPTTDTLSAGISDSISGLSKTRYGRIAAMSYDGTLALLSGNNEQEDSTIFHKGGAVLINTSTRNKITSFYHVPSNIISTNDEGSSLGKKFNGFGSSCRISSDNNHILVGGGGYAFKYSVANVKSLYFPFIANGTSEDGTFNFSPGSYSGSNGLTLGAKASVMLDLTTDFRFSNTAGFSFSFDMKPSTDVNTSNAIRISVDDSFSIRVSIHEIWSVGQRRVEHGIALAVKKPDYNVYINPSSVETRYPPNIDYSEFKQCVVNFNYDKDVMLKIGDRTSTSILPSEKLGSVGFLPFSNLSVLTIFSDEGASIKNLRMHAFY